MCVIERECVTGGGGGGVGGVMWRGGLYDSTHEFLECAIRESTPRGQFVVGIIQFQTVLAAQICGVEIHRILDTNIVGTFP